MGGNPARDLAARTTGFSRSQSAELLTRFRTSSSPHCTRPSSRRLAAAKEATRSRGANTSIENSAAQAKTAPDHIGGRWKSKVAALKPPWDMPHRYRRLGVPNFASNHGRVWSRKSAASGEGVLPPAEPTKRQYVP